MALVGLYPGTFDPIHNGHLDIIERAAKLVDKLVVGVAINEGKGPLFSLDERVAIIREALAHIVNGDRVEVRPFKTLLMHFAHEVGARAIFKGLRAVSDFESEFQMTALNQHLDREIETVFLMTDPVYQAIASRFVKEIAQLDGDVSDFVPIGVRDRLLAKFGRKA